MRALLIDDVVRLADIPAPSPSPGEALVRVTLAGICGTDLELPSGYMGFRGVPGHEFVGVVEDASVPEEQRRRWLGRRVAGEINIACGRCASCARGLGRHCPTRTVLGILGKDGAHAERLTLPLRNLHVVPDAVDDLDAVFAEPLAAACEILEQVPVQDATRAVVVGDGRMGQLVARVLRTVIRSVTVLGRRPSKLAHLAPLDVRIALSPEEAGTGFDLAVEATGSPGGLDAALGLLRPRGTLVLKSTYHGGRPLPVFRIVVDEITLVGSRCGRIEAALPLLASGEIPVRDLVSEVIPLDEAVRAYQRAADGEALKVLLKP
jgi:alcohol dehydrogenase